MREPVYRILAWYKSYNAAGRLRDWRNSDRGASAVEYALLLFAVVAAIAFAAFALSGRVTQMFTDTCKNINPGTTSCTKP